MWSSKAFLDCSQRLQRAGFEAGFELGDRVARGYADLGFEEFFVISGPRLVSIYSGAVSTLNSDHRHFFFVIPSVDRMVDSIEKCGFDFNAFNFENQRTWSIWIEDRGRMEAVEFRHNELPCALGEALIFAWENRRK